MSEATALERERAPDTVRVRMEALHRQIQAMRDDPHQDGRVALLVDLPSEEWGTYLQVAGDYDALGIARILAFLRAVTDGTIRPPARQLLGAAFALSRLQVGKPLYILIAQERRRYRRSSTATPRASADTARSKGQLPSKERKQAGGREVDWDF